MGFITNKTIASRRLILRPLTVEDAEDMFAFTSLSASSTFLRWEPHTSVEEDVRFILNALKDEESLYWGIEHKDAGKIIGNIHVYNIHFRDYWAEISYILHPYYYGNGYATEAVCTIIQYLLKKGLNRVQALCLAEHEQSEKLMVRCGMSYEGTLRDYAVVKGKKHDMKIYSICKEDVSWGE